MKINFKYENNNHLFVAVHNLVQMAFIYYIFSKLFIEEDFKKYMYHFDINGEEDDVYLLFDDCYLSKISKNIIPKELNYKCLNYKWFVPSNLSNFLKEGNVRIKKMIQTKNDFYLLTVTDYIQIQNDRRFSSSIIDDIPMIEYSYHYAPLGLDFKDLEQKEEIYEGVFSVMDAISDCTIFTGRIII